MKRLLSGIASALFLFTAQISHAQQVDIYPKPQSITWGTETAFANNAAFILDGSENADADAVSLFKKKFNPY